MTTPLAQLSGVTKRFGPVVALNGLDLHVEPAELFALLGPNGAGKSTAISLMLGLQRPDSGTVHLFGESPERLSARRQIGVMMQDAALVGELRVRELIDLTASYYPAPLGVAAALELTRTTALADRLYGKLSGGQKRQAQFAMAVVGRPSLLFLDEPTAGLDVQARESMWAVLRQLVADGCAVVLTTHYIEEAEALASRVAVVAKGQLVATGSVREVSAVVSRKQISCATSLSLDEIRSWPDVEHVVTRDAQRLQITAIDAESVVRRLLAADGGLRELEVRRAGLAEAFSALTQETVSQETA